jgi:hypothetical protein
VLFDRFSTPGTKDQQESQFMDYVDKKNVISPIAFIRIISEAIKSSIGKRKEHMTTSISNHHMLYTASNFDEKRQEMQEHDQKHMDIKIQTIFREETNDTIYFTMHLVFCE